MMFINPICDTEATAAYSKSFQKAGKKTAKTCIYEKPCRILQCTFRYASDIRVSLLTQHGGT